MSYQEYAQLGKGRNNSDGARRGGGGGGESAVNNSSNTTGVRPARQRSDTVGTAERPYVGSHISFSAPRRYTQMPPSTAMPAGAAAPVGAPSPTSSTSSTSLSPSNSASQKGFHHATTAGTAPFTGLSLAQLKEQLELNGGGGAGGADRKPELIVDAPMPWRPFYLQRRILATYLVIFVALIVVLEATLQLSSGGGSASVTGGGGLGPADNRSLRFGWQLLPAAGLALVCGLWHRVEYQAKSSAPWIRMSKGPADAERTLLLDYTTVIQPVALVKALKNKDFIAAAAVAVSLLLQGAVIVSTGLIAPSLLTVVDSNAQLVLRSRFAEDAGALANAGSLSLFHVAGLQQQSGVSQAYPDGVASRFAYQQFGTADSLPVGSQLSATVDGFFSNLSCETAQLAVGGVRATRLLQQFDTTVSTSTCSVTMQVSGSALARRANETVMFLQFGRGGCSGSTAAENQRVLVIAGVASIETNVSGLGNVTIAVNGTIPRSVQLLCRPGYSITKLNVVKNGTAASTTSSLVQAQLAASSSATAQATLRNISGWDIANAVFNSYRDSSVGAVQATDSAFPAFIPEEPQQGQLLQRVVVDPMMRFALGLKLKEQGSLPSADAFLDANALAGLATDYFQHHSALLAHTSALSQRESVPATGTSAARSERLVAGAVPVHLTVSILAVCIVLTVALSLLVPVRGILPRDPGTLMDTAALLGHSKPLLQALRGTGGADVATLWDRLGMAYFYTGVEAYEQEYTGGNGYFRIFGGPLAGEAVLGYGDPDASSWSHPLGMHPLLRALLFIVLAGLIASLEGTLRWSDANDGLATVSDNPVASILWTGVPASIIALVAMYLGLVDFFVRALAPFVELTRTGSFRSMTTNFLDKTTHFVVLESVKTRNFAVLFSTVAMSIGVLLPTFVAPLFVASAAPGVATIQIQTQDFFEAGRAVAAGGDFGSGGNAASVATSLVLDANVSFSPFTFQDLAFPRVAILPSTRFTNGIGSSNNVPDSAIISATLPAIRSSLSCRIFRQADIRVNLTNNYRTSSGVFVNPLRIDVPGVPARGTAEDQASTFIISTAAQTTQNTGTSASPSLAAIDRNAFFGAAKFVAAAGGGRGAWVYAWGQLENANTNSAAVKSVFALTCNETMQRVGVSTTFRGPSLAIDSSRPPVPIESTSRDLAVFVVVPSELESTYAGLVNISTPHLLDGFFASLVSSRFAVPVEMLGGLGLDNDQAVAMAIVAQHKIIRAQMVSAFSRRATDPGVSSSNTSSTPFASAAAAIEADSNTVGVSGSITFPATLQMPPSSLSSLSSTAASTSSSSSPPPRLRLHQDFVATRILQSFLAAILLLSAATWVLMPRTNILPRLGGLGASPFSIASVAALLADGNVFGLLGRAAEWKPLDDLRDVFRDGLHVTMRFRLGWDEVRSRDRSRNRSRTRTRWQLLQRQISPASRGVGTAGGTASGTSGSGGERAEEVFGISAVRTGGWGGGENVGLGLQARVGFQQRKFVRDWGWKS